MTATCPSCGCEQGAGLLCSSETDRLERDLGDVAAIVADLGITMSRQDKITSSGGDTPSPKLKEEDAGLSAIAHTRTPINFGAMNAYDDLANTLTTWARDVGEGRGWDWKSRQPAAVMASRVLLNHIPAIRKHPAADELVDEITDAIAQARRVVDRPADRVYLGQCLYEEGDVTCYEEIYANPGAAEVRCRVCGVTHPVGERRAWLLQRAEDMLFTAAKASEILGEIGQITVTQASIRGYIHRGKIAYRAPVDAKRFRLGDLLAVLLNESERKSA